MLFIILGKRKRTPKRFQVYPFICFGWNHIYSEDADEAVEKRIFYNKSQKYRHFKLSPSCAVIHDDLKMYAPKELKRNVELEDRYLLRRKI